MNMPPLSPGQPRFSGLTIQTDKSSKYPVVRLYDSGYRDALRKACQEVSDSDDFSPSYVEDNVKRHGYEAGEIRLNGKIVESENPTVKYVAKLLEKGELAGISDPENLPKLTNLTERLADAINAMEKTPLKATESLLSLATLLLGKCSEPTDPLTGRTYLQFQLKK